MEVLDYDTVILGSGLGGLTTAIHASLKGQKKIKIAVVTKLHAMRSHSVSAEVNIKTAIFAHKGNQLGN